MRTRTAVALALLLAPGVAAQKPSLPFISADALVGVSTHPDRVGETYYSGTPFATRLALAFRLGSPGTVRPVVMLDYSKTHEMSGDDAVCRSAPNGTCVQGFPTFSGFGAGLGLRAVLGDRAVVGATGGVARYQDRYTTDPSRRTATFVQVDAAFPLGGHVGLVLNVRHVELPKAAGDRVWFRPLSFGLRIQ